MDNTKVKILIGGGAGYVGSHLAPLLLDHGYDVTVMDLFWFGSNLPKEVKTIQKDLIDCTVEDLQGFDQFIFMGGLSNDPMAEFSPACNFIYNGALPGFLAFQAKKAGVKRFIYASSCSVYGYTIDELYDETAPTTCQYPYGISKLQGEKGIEQMQDDSFSTIILRKGTISGCSPRMRFDLVVNTMFKCAMTDGKLTINNPSIWRPILDIRDAAMGYLRSIQANYSISGVFNLASGNYTVGQIGDSVQNRLERLTGKKILVDVKNVQDFRNYKVTFEKAKTCLGFHPQYEIEDIITDLYENRNNFGDFEDDSYYNIRVFKKLELEKIKLNAMVNSKQREHAKLESKSPIESSVEVS